MADKLGFRLLLVDDDSSFRNDQVEILTKDPDVGDFRISSLRNVRDPARALELLKEWKPDISLIDNHYFPLTDNEPVMTGSDLAKKMRELGIKSPIIIISSKMKEGSHVAGAIDGGANDYLRMPFSDSELRATLNARLRDYLESENVTLRFGGFEFLPGKELLMRGGKVHERLTAMESKILKYLFLATGQTVDRSELLEKVWGYNSKVTTHTLETHVYRLRQKFEPIAKTPRYLITSNGGYRLRV